MADKEHAPDLPAEIIEQIFIWIKDDFEAIACAQLISKNFSVVLQNKLKINIEDIQISDDVRRFFQRRRSLTATQEMISNRFGDDISAELGVVELRVVMLGPRSGKTSFLRSFCSNVPPILSIDYQQHPTHPVQTHLPEIKVDGRLTEIGLWDSHRTDLRERTEKRSYLFGSVGVWLCFSIANRMKFKALLEQWLDEIIKCQVMPYTQFYLVGMCADLGHKRQVSREEAERVAFCLRMKYFECSSVDPIAHPVDFATISRDLLQARCHEPIYEDEHPNTAVAPSRRWCLLL